uniref:Putative Erf family protein n=1 Tax=viral metagenome TaxID=1070528 RepID=A0A6M3IH64_9ZZZZ
MSDLNELAAALAKAQGEIMPAPKDADNPFFKSKYASLPAVREAVRKAFADNGLSVVQMPEVDNGQLRLRTLLLHCSGQSLDCGTLNADVDLANPQKIGSAITYFRRYALAAVSQTVADEDDDANAASQKHPAPKLSAKDSAYVADALSEIKECDSLEALAAIGEILKDKTPAVQNAVRGVYAAQQRKLKDSPL